MKFCLILLSVILTVSSAAVQRNRQGSNNYYPGPSHPTVYHAPTKQSNYNSHSSSNDKDMRTIRNEQEIKDDGSYHYAYETENGIVGEESGVGGVAVKGSSSYISPEGIEIKTTYVADETGYHAVGDHIPKTPDYILRALEYIRTHPYKTNKEYEDGAKKATTNQYKASTYTATPTHKSTTSRRVTPSPYRQQPAKVTAKGSYSSTQKRGNSYRFKL